VSIFDRFRSKSGVPKGYAEVNVEFTEEENKAINSSLEKYDRIGHANAPEGSTMYIHPKAKNGMAAKALTEYVEDLMVELQDCGSNEEMASLMEKAIKAQMKAYAIHNLPVYLFQLAGMFELSGDTSKAKDFFAYFLRAQDEFKPDKVDTVFLNEAGFDMPRVIALAKEKLRS
jgi:hypothetical protein